MKKNKYIFHLTLITAFVFSAFITSCKDDELTDGVQPRLFQPINFNAELNKTVATITWAKADSAVNYTLQISQDPLFKTTLVDTTIVSLNFLKELAGETEFFARIRANAGDVTMNSKFNSTLSFKTPKENLFEGFGTNTNNGKTYSAYMTGVKTLTIKWQPKANVTHLILRSASGGLRDSVKLTSVEITAGEKTVSVSANSTWTVNIYNNKIIRGITSGVVEGDVVVNAGDDLVTALNNATTGQVIVLAPGTVFPMGTATYRLNKNIKVRGLSATNRPILCMASGATTSSSMLGFTDASTIDFVKFENIDFSGYCDNNSAATKIGYLFNNNVLTTVKSLTFNNCLLHNYGNTPMRLQGGKNQSIDTLSFNGCIINEIGYTSTYAIVNSNSADLFKNINFNNCTVYNFKGSLVLRTGQTINAVNITNCTINQGMQDAGSPRYLIDLNTASFTGSGVTIKNCVFGQTGTSAMGANGMRYVAGTTVKVTGTYYTSDYADDPIPAGATSSSIKSLMTAYAGLSTALWNAPATGDFKLKDTAFKGKGVAGDLRW